jgi:hypothetical protein
MEQAIKKYLLLSQLCLGLSVIICLILIPHFLFSTNEGGMSNYGVHLKTVIPYSLGLVLTSFYSVLAALSIKDKTSILRRLLFGYALALLLVLITTYGYKTNVILKNTHIAVTIVFFWFELGSSAWMVRRFLSDKINIGLVILQVVGLILGSLTFFGSLHLLFVAQLLTIVPFGLVLVRSSAGITKKI